MSCAAECILHGADGQVMEPADGRAPFAASALKATVFEGRTAGPTAHPTYVACGGVARSRVSEAPGVFSPLACSPLALRPFRASQAAGLLPPEPSAAPSSKRSSAGL